VGDFYIFIMATVSMAVVQISDVNMNKSPFISTSAYLYNEQ